MSLALAYEFDADFVDIFEVRGSKREKEASDRSPGQPASVLFAYCGLDKVMRETRLNFYPQPRALSQ